MGKRKPNKGEYNDFVDSEKLRDNSGVRTTLQGPSMDLTSLGNPVSPPARQKSPHNAAAAQEKGAGTGSGDKERAGRAEGGGQGKLKGKGKGKGQDSKGGLKKPPLTHFLCLPLVNADSRPVLETGLAKLGDEVEKSGVVPRRAIRPVGTLHLTLGVMSLDDEGLAGAGKYLQELVLKGLLPGDASEEGKTGIEQKLATLQHWTTERPKGSISASPARGSKSGSKDYIEVDLKSLVPMQRARQTSILYAEPVDATARLRSFAESLKKEFTEKGFVINEDRALKLHATILNTIYAKPNGRGGKGPKGKGKATATPDPSIAETEVPPTTTAEGASKPFERSKGHGPNAKSWMRIDATDLIEQYKEFVWAKGVRIDRVQICKMGAKKIVDGRGEVVDEKYEVVWEKEI